LVILLYASNIIISMPSAMPSPDHLVSHAAELIGQADALVIAAGALAGLRAIAAALA
jgi:hypothetical protein